MNRASLLFLGIFFALAFSFTTIVLTNQVSYGSLKPHFDEGENEVFPQVLSGVAARGKLVYQDLGCAYCHTQQVRRPGFGADTQRGWGERQSMARDYIRESRVLIGDMRIGPDLRNVGAREARDGKDYTADWHYRHLYNPQLASPGTVMPSFKFLFETRKIVGQPSPKALHKILPTEVQPAAGYEIVPTERAEALVAYLLTLKNSYSYPEETKRIYVEPKKEDATKTAPAVEGHK